MEKEEMKEVQGIIESQNRREGERECGTIYRESYI